MQQIAERLGLSKFAVSKALSGKSGVSADTRAKIIETATQLGYFAQNRTSRARGRSAAGGERKGETVVVLIPNVRYQTRGSRYWGKIIDGIDFALEKRKLGMMLATEQGEGSLARLINPEGVLGLIGVGLISGQQLLEVRSLRIPFVLVDHEDPLVPADALFANNGEGMRRIVDYLIGEGHLRLQFVGNIRYSRSFGERWLGFRSALEEREIGGFQEPELLALAGENRSELTEALEPILRRMLGEGTLPTALVCANDSLAICAMTALMKLGASVPADCSVTGFDNIEDAALARPPLTTVHVDKEGLGRRAVEALLRRIERPGEPRERILLTGDVVLRQSATARTGRNRAGAFSITDDNKNKCIAFYPLPFSL
nr:LacI family DNA-binding transcriptional regulator [Cohnella algarum]